MMGNEVKERRVGVERARRSSHRWRTSDLGQRVLAGTAYGRDSVMSTCLLQRHRCTKLAQVRAIVDVGTLLGHTRRLLKRAGA